MFTVRFIMDTKAYRSVESPIGYMLHRQLPVLATNGNY